MYPTPFSSPVIHLAFGMARKRKAQEKQAENSVIGEDAFACSANAGEPSDQIPVHKQPVFSPEAERIYEETFGAMFAQMFASIEANTHKRGIGTKVVKTKRKEPSHEIASDRPPEWINRLHAHLQNKPLHPLQENLRLTYTQLRQNPQDEKARAAYWKAVDAIVTVRDLDRALSYYHIAGHKTAYPMKPALLEEALASEATYSPVHTRATSPVRTSQAAENEKPKDIRKQIPKTLEQIKVQLASSLFGVSKAEAKVDLQSAVKLIQDFISTNPEKQEAAEQELEQLCKDAGFSSEMLKQYIRKKTAS